MTSSTPRFGYIARARSSLSAYLLLKAQAALGRGGAYLICMYARTLSVHAPSKTRPPQILLPLPIHTARVSDELDVCGHIYIDFAGPLFSLSIRTPAPVTAGR